MRHGAANGQLKSFIDSIPAIRLENFAPSAMSNPIYSDMNFRLDMQGITSAGEFNLQVQVNRQTTIRSLRVARGNTVAGPVLVSPYMPMTAEEVRRELHHDTRDFVPFLLTTVGLVLVDESI